MRSEVRFTAYQAEVFGEALKASAELGIRYAQGMLDDLTRHAAGCAVLRADPSRFTDTVERALKRMGLASEVSPIVDAAAEYALAVASGEQPTPGQALAAVWMAAEDSATVASTSSFCFPKESS